MRLPSPSLPNRLRNLLASFCLGFFAATLPFAAIADGKADHGLSLDERLAELSSEELENLLVFVGGNALFATYHEAGHMLISEFRIPVLGQEEDAVDNLATIVMLSDETDDRDLLLINAMIGWFLVSSDEETDLVFYGEHDLDEQRGFRILCLMVGADEETFADIARDLEMPDERIESCAYDYAQTSDSWREVTDPHTSDSDEPGGKVSVSHEPASEGLESVVLFMKEAEILEQVAEDLDTYFKLPEQITLRTTSCGGSNAYWDANDRSVTLCHELLGAFAELYLDEIANAD